MFNKHTGRLYLYNYYINNYFNTFWLLRARTHSLSLYITLHIKKILYAAKEVMSLCVLRASARSILLRVHIRTRACKGNPVCRKFLQNVLGQWFPYNVTIMQRTGQPPVLPSPLVSTIAVLRLFSHRPRASSIVPLTLKPLKRSHSRPCSSERRACSRITFGSGTWACRLLTLLHRWYNSVPATRNVISDVAKEPFDSA